MVLKKGKGTDKFSFSISAVVIPSIAEQPVKSLDKILGSNTKESAAIQKLNQGLGTKGLPSLDLPGTVYQNVVLPGFHPESCGPCWSIHPNNNCCTSRLLWKCLGLPCSHPTAALYGLSNSFQLSFTGLAEEFLVTRTGEVLQNRVFRRCEISSAG